MVRAGSEAGLESRIRQRAQRRWVEEGRPGGGAISGIGRARELSAIEDNQRNATRPRSRHSHAAWAHAAGAHPLGSHAFGGEPVEPLAAVETQGAFPDLADQGEEFSVRSRGREPR